MYVQFMIVDIVRNSKQVESDTR